MTDFWKNWLMVWCGVVGVFGVVLAGGALGPTDGPVRVILAILDGPGEATFDPHLRFSIGLMGAVTIGWSLTLVAAIHAADQLGERGGPIWKMILIAGLTWYTIDCALSIATGFWLNTASNTLLMLGLAIPIFQSGVLGDGGTPAAT